MLCFFFCIICNNLHRFCKLIVRTFATRAIICRFFDNQIINGQFLYVLFGVNKFQIYWLNCPPMNLKTIQALFVTAYSVQSALTVQSARHAYCLQSKHLEIDCVKVLDCLSWVRFLQSVQRALFWLWPKISASFWHSLNFMISSGLNDIKFNELSLCRPWYTKISDLQIEFSTLESKHYTRFESTQSRYSCSWLAVSNSCSYV